MTDAPLVLRGRDTDLVAAPHRGTSARLVGGFSSPGRESSALLVFAGRLVNAAQHDLPPCRFTAIGMGAAQCPGDTDNHGVTSHVLQVDEAHRPKAAENQTGVESPTGSSSSTRSRSWPTCTRRGSSPMTSSAKKKQLLGVQSMQRPLAGAPVSRGP